MFPDLPDLADDDRPEERPDRAEDRAEDRAGRDEEELAARLGRGRLGDRTSLLVRDGALRGVALADLEDGRLDERARGREGAERERDGWTLGAREDDEDLARGAGVRDGTERLAYVRGLSVPERAARAWLALREPVVRRGAASTRDCRESGRVAFEPEDLLPPELRSPEVEEDPPDFWPPDEDLLRDTVALRLVSPEDALSFRSTLRDSGFRLSDDRGAVDRLWVVRGLDMRL